MHRTQTKPVNASVQKNALHSCVRISFVCAKNRLLYALQHKPLKWFIIVAVGVAVVAYTIAVVATSLEVAGALFGIGITFILWFGGSILFVHDMPPWWRWMHYLDPLHYAFGAYMVRIVSRNYNLSIK